MAELFHANHYLMHQQKRSPSLVKPFYTWLSTSFKERLSVIKRSFKTILVVGNYEDTFLEVLPAVADIFLFEAEANCLKEPVSRFHIIKKDVPLSEYTFDAIFAPCYLHTVEDPIPYLKSFASLLKPDGLLMGCLPGEETLQELRHAFLSAETNVYDGVTPHIAPMMTLQDVSHMLLSSGFALPVADREKQVIDYTDLNRLYKDLKALGETNCLTERRQGLTHPKLFDAIQTAYTHVQNMYPVTLTFLFYIAWAPAGNQPQPLRPGQGRVSLTDVL